MKIRAAVARAGSPFTIETCELGEPGADEVLVRVEACGVCHTDLSAKDHGYGTPLPAVLGHEGVGRIVALGEGVDRFNIGDRVVMSFGACGRCPSCEGGAPSYCRHTVNFNMLGRRISGGSPISLSGEPITGHFFGQSAFATHAIASATNVVRLDEDLPPALMTTLACGVQTGVGAIINVLRAEASDAIGIFGCGTVGLAAVMAAKIVGCARIVAVDVREDRLATAQVLGATEIVDNRRGDASEIIKKVGLTLAFDNTGVASVIEAGFAALRPRGRMVLAGLSAPGTKLKIDANRIMAAGRTLRGTVEGDADPRTFIPRMIDWYRRGLLPLERLVTIYPFELIEDAAADMLAGVVIKPVLLMQDNTPRPVGPEWGASMTVKAKFERLATCEAEVPIVSLQQLFDELEPIDLPFMLGEWDGGVFKSGHPGEKQLTGLGWVGKTFHGNNDVDPIVTRDEKGERVANPILGKASLRMVAYRGAVTATMIYDKHPIFDHFRKVDDDLVVGVMDRKGEDVPLFFYLRRLPGKVSAT